MDGKPSLRVPRIKPVGASLADLTLLWVASLRSR
ncbi:hypothetical protein JOE48_005866 [Methylobacterium sp. PvR107]|nr:hypothetical protein [Methylobacterium sp. PvR107]